MLNRINLTIDSGDNSHNTILGPGATLITNQDGRSELLDPIARSEIELLKKRRFFYEFNRRDASLLLGERLLAGNLSGSSSDVRATGLAWCARVLSVSGTLDQAERFVAQAKSLSECPEIEIAEAFIAFRRDDKAGALIMLSRIDNPLSRTAAFIVKKEEGAENALKWFEATGYSLTDLDSDGKYQLLMCQIQTALWDKAMETIGTCASHDFLETPLLHHWVGIVELMKTIQPDFRDIVVSGVPFGLLSFPIASHSDAMICRREARQHFLSGVEAARNLSLPKAEKVDSQYALWLELIDSDSREQGFERLTNALRAEKPDLGLVQFALEFGVVIDINTVEREIERQTAIAGSMSIEAARARFAIALHQQKPEIAADYLSKHSNQLSEHINKSAIIFYQVKFLLEASMIEQARQLVQTLDTENISTELREQLYEEIERAQASDPIKPSKEQYLRTKALSDLLSLVLELERYERWDDLATFARQLFELTSSLSDAERLLKALNHLHNSKLAVAFLKERQDLLRQSSFLRISYAWALFFEGEILESIALLETFSDAERSADFRNLKIHLSIASGNWTSLSSFISDEHKKKDERSAQEMINVANLALHIGSPLAKELLFIATQKAETDPHILSAAYFYATAAGWEDESGINQWLNQAVQHSGNDGPIKRMTLKEVISRKPEWSRHQSGIWKMLEACQTPLFLAAQSLNQTLVHLTTFPSFVNTTESDVRRRQAIPAFSGKHLAGIEAILDKPAAMDVTALLTLSFLNVLDVALDAFPIVYIPHSTLSWLFEENHKATFHQPSQIRNARTIRDYLATGELEYFAPKTDAKSDLVSMIGYDLAALITEAQTESEGNGSSQRLVIRSAPVHRISGWMDEEADLSEYTSVITDCLSLVKRLRQQGQITVTEEAQAIAYLQLHEKSWPEQPEIADGATLFLDDLSVTYLLHTGLLGKLKRAGYRAIVSPRTSKEINLLSTYERLSNDVRSVLERIRTSLQTRIASGRVKIGRRERMSDLEKQSIPEHPSVDILALTSYCDVAIIDDRFFNQHRHIGNDAATMTVLTTYQLLDALVEANKVTPAQNIEYRTQLRRAGYIFLPVDEHELGTLLNEAPVQAGQVMETAELKAIRESVLHVRMTNWLNHQDEDHWLNRTLETFSRVLKNVWKTNRTLPEIEALSDWLLAQLDVRGWAQALEPKSAEHLVKYGRALFILRLLLPPEEDQPKATDAYWDWIGRRILIPLQEQSPELYEHLVRLSREYIDSIDQMSLTVGNEP